MHIRRNNEITERGESDYYHNGRRGYASFYGAVAEKKRTDKSDGGAYRFRHPQTDLTDKLEQQENDYDLREY